MLRLVDHWVWDSWLAASGDEHHLFFLRAPRELRDPERRHLSTSVGHAVSTDLRRWTVLPDPLERASASAWDGTAVWTGSISPHDGRWYLFYTGVDGGGAQRVGIAVSDDLHTWQRHGAEPVAGPDPRWYAATAWRDPFVFADPAGRGWHMLVTAHAAGEGRGRGVIGHARSADLLHWSVRPPLTRPAGFDHLQVPQVHQIDDTTILLFSCQPAMTTLQRRNGSPLSGTWVVAGGSVGAGWDVAAATPFAHPSLSAARLARDPAGGWCLLGFRDWEHGVFHGEIIDPIPVAWTGRRLVERIR
ncbi:family 43 glycosylhydrolase [Dactylosporangium sp. AC04546]|uniref:family 43 glycosylhydrolase n=1 Tax=Dactylosporangium sp. AC04546 TaxID=2862460 RepID=UPI001EDF9012|nr:family 43 glycosylhydrolase [Dactylosporangium sp. AC04546]WVK79751.1 family 43 glycosylhydrolase [Dactylosporangium sp. AC04546]